MRILFGRFIGDASSLGVGKLPLDNGWNYFWCFFYFWFSCMVLCRTIPRQEAKGKK